MAIIRRIMQYKADGLDIALTKIAVFAAALLLAKIWRPILDLSWYWYALVWVICAIRPFSKFYHWTKSSENAF